MCAIGICNIRNVYRSFEYVCETIITIKFGIALPAIGNSFQISDKENGKVVDTFL